MYIPYEIIGNSINSFFKNENLHNFFYIKKVEQNVRYIEKNKQEVLKRLKNKLSKSEKLNIVFYVYDETKWKCQVLYDLLINDGRFNVRVLVTKPSCLNQDNPSYISDEKLKEVYAFFKEKSMNVEYAFDIKTSKFVSFKKFAPDIIFYQHPWYVKTEQGPVVCSRFALTCYIPYYFPIEAADIDCNLRFHKYVERYYVLDEYTRDKYLKENQELGRKLKTVGYPYLDKFCGTTMGEYIIYAPHWTVKGNGLAYGTFEWSGKFILDYAKSHPEIKWIFKPHPLLKKALVDFGIMSEIEAKNYYDEWDNLGIKYESGNYLELFGKSKMMITDCSSFLGEYFVTEKPLIHLMSEKSQFKNSDNPILKAYYRANNLEELQNLLETVPQNDYMKDLRVQTLERTGLKCNCASEKILNDIITLISA